jgi:hypothetical protein
MADDPLSRLKQKRDAINARIKAQEARQRTGERRRETRRKVLVGAAVLYRAESDAAFGEELQRMLDKFLARDDERAIFGLAARSQAA